MGGIVWMVVGLAGATTPICAQRSAFDELWPSGAPNFRERERIASSLPPERESERTKRPNPFLGRSTLTNPADSGAFGYVAGGGVDFPNLGSSGIDWGFLFSGGLGYSFGSLGVVLGYDYQQAEGSPGSGTNVTIHQHGPFILGSYDFGQSLVFGAHGGGRYTFTADERTTSGLGTTTTKGSKFAPFVGGHVSLDVTGVRLIAVYSYTFNGDGGLSGHASDAFDTHSILAGIEYSF